MGNQPTIVIVRHGPTLHNQMINSKAPQLEALLQNAIRKGASEADLIELLHGTFKRNRQAEESVPLARGKGPAQCHTAKAWLEKEGYRFKACFCSPYKRAVDSAKIIASGHVKRTTYEQLCERDLGVFHNLPRPLFYQFFPNEARKKAVNPLDWTPPDGQTLRSLLPLLRSVAKDATVRARAGEHVLIVAHADTNVGLRLLPELSNMIGTLHKKGPGAWNPLWVQNGQIDCNSFGDPAGGPIATLPTHFRSVAFSERPLDTRWTPIKR